MLERKDIYKNYVAKSDNKIVGFISMVFYKTCFHPGGTALINELIVAQKYRGKGIGKSLLERAIKVAVDNSSNEIEVSTTNDNEAAIRFYQRNGLIDESILLGKELAK